MKEIEVGEYVRTKEDLIAKYLGFKKNDSDMEYNKYLFDNEIYWYYEYYNEYVYEKDWKQFKEDIVKHSKNLIDLIEVGDIVNGFSVLDIDTVLKIGEGKALDIGYGNYIFDDEISTILTKEQYMANCYKVGGKDE